MYDLLLLASAIIFAATSIAYLRHPAAGLMHPATFYLAFHGFIFVIRPIVARIYDFNFVYRLFEFMPSISDKITVILAANLAMVVFVASSLYIAKEPPAPLDDEVFARARASLTKPIIVVAALLSPLAVWSLLENWQQRSEEFGSMIRDAATGTAINIGGVGWLTDASLFLAPITVMIIWLARYRWWSWAFFGVFMLLQGGTGIRGPIIYAASAIGILALLEMRRRWFDWRVMALACVAALAFGQLVLDRGASLRGVLGGGAEVTYTQDAELAPLEGMDFANLEYFEYVVYAVPQRSNTYDYFASNLQVFTEPVPRALWKDKPVGPPIQNFSLWDYGRPIGMTASLPGAGWLSLGYVGVVIQTLFFAMLYAYLFVWLLTRRATPLAHLAYALLIATAFNVLRDGTLLTFARQMPFYLGPLLMVVLAQRLLGPARGAHVHDWNQPVSEFLAQSPAERRRSLASQTKDQR
ncbi:O-antigen polymerase [Qipengyuania psychrotolerans]|uniref:Oligosaccharide repeat unit polymerase n=1 Tax=Qipengyuania psychrotolerans TaxID=2867238 RepID=A0ABX8ZES2_9SPHN|nr:O-antigen polymerase [Qipengyuania psychrotolerans]QZD87501.1 oligosaccharide repeat unit polymerase [Qipengyuania psychrotolerans]